MKRFEKIFFGSIIGGFFPLLGGLLAVVIWFYASRDESIAPYSLIGGITAGLIIDVIFLKRWIEHLYELPLFFISGIFVFYHIGIYGMFMGFPVFNMILAPPVGLYFARRRLETQDENISAKKVSFLSALILFIFCCYTTFLLIVSESPEMEVQHMLHSIITLTPLSFWILYPVGAILLIAMQYLITRWIFTRTLKSAQTL